MSISNNNLLRKRTAVLPIVVLFLIFSASLLAQDIDLQQLNHYSFYTDHTANETVTPDIKAVFVNDTDRAYFNLSNYHPGTSTGVIIGKINHQQISFLDTLNTGTPDQLTNFFVDDNEDITFSAWHWYGGLVKKISWSGETQWEKSYNSLPQDTIIHPFYSFGAMDGSTMLLTRSTISDTLFNNTLVKLNNLNGNKIWETDFLLGSSSLSTPIMAREINGRFHALSYNISFTNISVINQEGTIQSLSQKPNQEQEFIHKSQHIDQEGNVYLGLISWGLRFPKINSFGDTLWLYERPSPFGDETLNRTTQINTDQNLNVYVAGPYKLQEEGSFSMLISKVNPDGNLIWEQSTHSLFSDDEYFYPINGYIFDNKIWYTGRRRMENGNSIGAIICYDLEGNFQLYKEFEELSFKGQTASIDYLDDELLITGSTGSTFDSIYQHILHYRIDTTTSTQQRPEQIIVSPYPNPTADFISIKDLRIDQLSNLNLHDLSGQSINTAGLITSANTFDLRRLANGIYLLSYTYLDKNYVAKIVKQ